MTVKNIEQAVGIGIWRLLLASTAMLATLVGGIMWLAKVDATATQALELAKETAAKNEVISNELHQIKISLTEMKQDLKYSANTLSRIEQSLKEKR